MIGKRISREPLRVPSEWKQQDRAFVIQLERILDDIYDRVDMRKINGRCDTLDEEVASLNEDVGSLEGAVGSLDTRVTTLERATPAWQLVYPVGSIYMSVVATSPATLFGGTWEKLKDRFLLGSGDTYSAGSTGGAATVSYTPAGSNSGGSVGNHTLTTTEIPSHNHGWTGTSATCSSVDIKHTHSYTDYYASTPTGNCAISEAQMPKHSHSVAYGLSGGATSYLWANAGGTKYNTSTSEVGSTNNHNHTVSNTSASRTSGEGNKNHNHTVTATGSIGNSGGGGAHNHGFTNPTFTGTAATINKMPPYLVVNMWKRTA